MALNNSDLTLRVGFDIAKFQAELNKTTGALNKWHSTVKNTLLQVSAGFGALSIGKFVINSLASFESEMQKVRSVTNASNGEFHLLRNNAIELAKAYGFTSAEVAKLQLEYARLGLTTSEILNSSKAAILLSKATGEDLALSAQIAGSTLRSFNLDATEMNRIADVMAASFNKSALGLADFGEAIKYVAPVAASAGLSIEQVSAMLGVLADNGIKGSMAGTSLRKIISDLGKGAAPILTQKLAEMAKEGLNGAQAMDEVGRTAYASLLILSKNSEKVDIATQAYKNAKGELQSMADIMQDSLLGDWSKFNGQLDATIQKGSGIIGVFRAIVQTMTGMVAVAGGDMAKPGKHWFLDALGLSSGDAAEANGAASTWESAQNKVTKATEAVTVAVEKEKESVKKLVEEWEKIKVRPDIDISQAKTTAIGVPTSFGGDQNAQNALNAMAQAQGALSDAIDRANQKADEQKDKFMQLAEVAANVGSQIGSSVAAGINGMQSAVQVMRNIADAIVSELFRMAYMAIVTKNVLKLGPAGLVVAAAAIAGLQALVSGVLRGGNRGGGGSGGGGGGSYGGDSLGSRIESPGQRIEIVFAGDAYKVLNAKIADQNRRDGRLKIVNG